MLSRQLSIGYLIATPIVGAISVLGNVQVAGKSVSGIVWSLLLAVGLYLLAISQTRRLNRFMLVQWFGWLAWVGFMWLSLLWGTGFDILNVQNVLQMSMPVVVGLVAATAVETDDDLRRILRGFAIAGGILACFAAVFVVLLRWDPDFSGPRDAALLAVLLGALCFAQVPQRTMWGLLGWGACLAFTLVSGSRIALVALLAMPVVHIGYRSVRWNIASFLSCVVLGIALFYTPMVQERFFHSGRGDFGDLFSDDVNGAGRFNAWPYVWDEAWKHPWLGAGVGSVTKFVPTVWEEMGHVHNDYLRLGFEFGVVGLALFAVVAIWQLSVLFRRIGKLEGVARTTCAAAWLGFWGLLISCTTDNTLIYNLYYTDPLFLLIGAVYGVSICAGQRIARESYHPPLPLGALPT